MDSVVLSNSCRLLNIGPRFLIGLSPHKLTEYLLSKRHATQQELSVSGICWVIWEHCNVQDSKQGNGCFTRKRVVSLHTQSIHIYSWKDTSTTEAWFVIVEVAVFEFSLSLFGNVVKVRTRELLAINPRLFMSISLFSCTTTIRPSPKQIPANTQVVVFLILLKYFFW